MKNAVFFLFLSISTILYSQQKLSGQNNFLFYENIGQIVDQQGKENKNLKYLFHSPGLNVQLRTQGFSYDVYEIKKAKNPNFKKDTANQIPQPPTFSADEFLSKNN